MTPPDIEHRASKHPLQRNVTADARPERRIKLVVADGTRRDGGDTAHLPESIRPRIHVSDIGVRLDMGEIEIEPPGGFGKDLRGGSVVTGSEVLLQC
ncbi:hypothetical protein D3C87_1281420 [compost metagenome]